MPAAPIAGRTLQVEILTASGLLPPEAGARPMILHGIVGDNPVLIEVIEKLPADAVGVAARVAEWLKSVFAKAGRPRTIDVRRADVAKALGDALAEERVPVRVKPRPRESAALIRALRASLDQTPIINLPSTVHKWSAWDAPAPVLAGTVEAAAEYYRAAPWTLIDDRLRITMTTADGAVRELLVLGAGGEVTGLAMVELARDADVLTGRQVSGGKVDDGSPFDRLEGGIVQIDFNPEGDLPPQMRREFRHSRWPVAGPQAWPIVMATNTLGGALAPIQFLELTDAILGVARLVSSRPEAVFEVERSDTPMEWRDEVSGASFAVTSRYTANDRPWSMASQLLPCLPQGPGAEPAAALVEHTEEALNDDAAAVLERFEAWLAGRPAQRRTKDRHVANAELFVEDFLGHYQGIPVRAVTEYDLRIFLYDHLPRKVIQSRRETLEMLPSLRLLFQFLSAVEGIDAPWAEEPLADQRALGTRVDTCPGHFFWEEGLDRWGLAHDNDLRRRLLLHDGRLTREIGFGHDFGAGMVGMGSDETRIERELNRRWLIWRDDLLADALGAESPPSPYHVFTALQERRDRWVREPQPALGRRTPIQVVKAERKGLLRQLKGGKRGGGRVRGQARGRGRDRDRDRGSDPDWE